MCKDYFVCEENELKELIKRENIKRNKTPKIYMAGYTKYLNWVYEEDYTPDSDYTHENFCFVDYSDDCEDKVWDKFFNYTALKSFNEEECKKITIDKEEYSIDIFYNEFEYCSLSAFWHSAQMSEEEIDWLRGKDG